MPALDWVEGLEKVDVAKLMAKATRVDKYFAVGAPMPETFETVGRSKTGLVEFRITPKRAKAPHLRMLGVLNRRAVGATYWAALGLKKQKNALEKKDIDAADGIAAKWKEQGGAR